MGAFLALLDPIGKIIDRVLPDKAAATAAKAQLLQTEVQGEFSLALAQLDVDKAEAASNSTWVAGWRPGIGWTCGLSLFYTFIVQPSVVSIAVLAHWHGDLSAMPKIDNSSLMGLVLTMLGMGALRSQDKKNNAVGNGS